MIVPEEERDNNISIISIGSSISSGRRAGGQGQQEKEDRKTAKEKKRRTKKRESNCSIKRELTQKVVALLGAQMTAQDARLMLHKNVHHVGSAGRGEEGHNEPPGNE